MLYDKIISAPEAAHPQQVSFGVVSGCRRSKARGSCELGIEKIVDIAGKRVRKSAEFTRGNFAFTLFKLAHLATVEPNRLADLLLAHASKKTNLGDTRS
jgi:hypothetical protein